MPSVDACALALAAVYVTFVFSSPMAVPVASSRTALVLVTGAGTFAAARGTTTAAASRTSATEDR